jgi:ankyrin repeat protein
LSTKRFPVWQDLVDFPLLFDARVSLDLRRVDDRNNFSLQTEEMIFDFLSSDSKRLTHLCLGRLPQNKPKYEPDPLPDGFELDAAISYAARAGLDNIIRRFMAEGSSFNAEGHWTGPGFFRAIQSRKSSTVNLFLDAGTDANLRDKNEMTPLSLAINHQYDAIVRVLIDVEQT